MAAPRILSREDKGGKQREAECPSEGIGPYELTFEGHSDGSALNVRTVTAPRILSRKNQLCRMQSKG
ncbi:MAG: hypothetical protein J6X71_01825 [Bacteroidales bacterium]|nr:hypothetical protein [Bacteroidales bacterium]